MEPRTEAGKAMRKMWSLDGGEERRLIAAILAIEAEASQPALSVETLAAALESLHPFTGWTWLRKDDAGRTFVEMHGFSDALADAILAALSEQPGE